MTGNDRHLRSRRSRRSFVRILGSDSRSLTAKNLSPTVGRPTDRRYIITYYTPQSQIELDRHPIERCAEFDYQLDVLYIWRVKLIALPNLSKMTGDYPGICL